MNTGVKTKTGEVRMNRPKAEPNNRTGISRDPARFENDGGRVPPSVRVSRPARINPANHPGGPRLAERDESWKKEV